MVFCWTLFREATRSSADGLPLVRLFTSCVPSGFVMVPCVALSVSGVKERRKIGGMRSAKSSVSHTCWAPINFLLQRTNRFQRDEPIFPNDRIPTGWSNLAHPINHAFGSVHNRLVSFRQKFGQNWKILHWILRTFRVGLNIDNVGWRMPGKILLEGGPGAGRGPAAGIKTRDRSAENITREREGCDVAAGRTSVSV